MLTLHKDDARLETSQVRSIVAEIKELLLHKPPALFLHATFRGIQHHQLAALLQFGVTKDHGLAFVVIGEIFGRGFIGMDPLGV